MTFKLKRVLLACLFALPSLLPAALPAFAAQPQRVSDDIKVQVNDQLVQFEGAQPFVDQRHKLQVPIRAVADKLGLQLKWEPVGEQFKITLSNAKKSVQLTTGSPVAGNDGQTGDASDVASLIDGSAYAPFRYLADAFDIQTQWDGDNRIAILGADGQYHAPAWYRQAKKVATFQQVIHAKATAYTASPSENGGHSLDYMGNPLQLGTIAVDPAVIPLGSKLYIEGYTYDGLPAGGMYAIASDIGGAVNGNRIDIFVPQSQSEARKFGVQQVKITILGS